MKTIPFSSQKRKSTKEVILQILSKQHPLKTQELHVLCQKKSGHVIGRSAFYERLKQLQKEQVIHKTIHGYELSEKWIKQMKIIGDDLQQNYPKEYDGHPHHLGGVMDFSSLDKLDAFYYKFKKDFIEQVDSKKQNNIITIAPHLCWDFLSLNENIQLMKKAVKKKIKHFVVIKGDSNLDKLSEELCKKIGLKVKIGAKVPFNYLVVIFNDVMLMFHYHPTMVGAIESMCKKAKGIEDVHATKYIDLYGAKLKHYAFIITNKKVIEWYKDYALSFFKKF